MTHRRNGFVLLTLLWFLTGVTSLALAAMIAARGAARTVENRRALVRAEWRAEECVARTLAAFEAESRARSDDQGTGNGRSGAPSLRVAVASSALVTECPGEVDLVPFGSGLDVNHVREALLSRAIRAYGVPDAEADSLTDALLDWRDADDSARAFGAERAWYVSRGEEQPRNGPLASVQELLAVRGYARWLDESGDNGIGSILSVDSGRVYIETVPVPVLEALPGMSAAAVAAIEQHRRAGSGSLPELLSLLSIVPERSRPSLEVAFGELGDALTVSIEGWVLRARSSGVIDAPTSPRLAVEIELRLIPEGRRLAVVERRLR